MTTVYFKATRLNGTDFHTGKVLYEVGKRVRPLPHAGDRHICGPGMLHAADVPAETLVSGHWPCRLFEVSGKPVAGFDERYPHKGGFRQLEVVNEVDAHLALGPNGLEVAALVERAARLTSQEAQALAAAWGAARDAARGAARDAARDAARNAARNAAWAAAWDAARDAAWGAARDAARDAAGDAAGALVVRDLISVKHFDVLYGPWAKVIG